MSALVMALLHSPCARRGQQVADTPEVPLPTRMVSAQSPDAARTATLALLDARAAGATVCPSEVARVLAGDGGDWRAAMPVVHAVVDAMVADGVVQLSWKGAAMAVRAGPYRIGRG